MMALSEPSIEKENNKQTTEEKLDGSDQGSVQVITGPTEIEGSGSENATGQKLSLNKVRQCVFVNETETLKK